jgi:hypothetical protein
MEDFLREHIAEIALLIYILFPLLKRVFGRSKAPGEQPRKRAETQPARGRTAPKTKRPARQQPRPGPATAAPAPPAIEPRPAQPDLLDAARAETRRLMQETWRLIGQAESNPRLARLAPALREDLLGRLTTIARSTEGSPTLSTIVQGIAALRALEELLGYLSRITRQRMLASGTTFSLGDRMIDDCYAPLLEFCIGQNLKLKTSEPLAVSAGWSHDIGARFASTRVAPIRLPQDFEQAVWGWPALAGEVARDFYYSLTHLERDLHDRLNLPHEVQVPASDAEVDGRWLTKLFGPWLSEIFGDVMGVLMLGPAYGEMLRRACRNPAAPQRTAAILQDAHRIDEQPPARLRVYVSIRVLHHLGRHDEADALWDQWEAEHPDIRLYFLPIAGRWAGVADQTLHSAADFWVDMLIQSPFPELDGFQLMSIPGLAYLHAEHAEVERVMRELVRGITVDTDSRWILAAAVLAAAAQPAVHDSILDVAKRSISSREGEERTPEPGAARPLQEGTIGQTLVTSLRSPRAIREAILLDAALGGRRR